MLCLSLQSHRLIEMLPLFCNKIFTCLCFIWNFRTFFSVMCPAGSPCPISWGRLYCRNLGWSSAGLGYWCGGVWTVYCTTLHSPTLNYTALYCSHKTEGKRKKYLMFNYMICSMSFRDFFPISEVFFSISSGYYSLLRSPHTIPKM